MAWDVLEVEARSETYTADRSLLGKPTTERIVYTPSIDWKGLKCTALLCMCIASFDMTKPRNIVHDMLSHMLHCLAPVEQGRIVRHLDALTASQLFLVDSNTQTTTHLTAGMPRLSNTEMVQRRRGSYTKQRQWKANVYFRELWLAMLNVARCVAVV